MREGAANKGSSEVRVLHVDDEPVICDVTKLSLERWGEIKVDVVHSGPEALEVLKNSSYACVISDYEMPVMNGIELLKKIRAFDSDIPFILFSGRGRETIAIDAINTGADFIIQKGGDTKSLFAELNHKVKYAIEQRNARLALKRRDAVLEAISLVANLFLDGHTFDKALQEAILLFGLSTEVDRVMVFQNNMISPEHLSLYHLYEWYRLSDSEMERPERNLSVIPDEFGPDWIYHMERGEPVVISIKEAGESCRNLLELFHIKSLAILPVYVDKAWWGMVWFCDCLSDRRWAEVELDALVTASAMIGSAIVQERMKLQLTESRQKTESMYSMMRHLCDTVPDLLWAKDLDGRYLFVNKTLSTRVMNTTDTSDPIGKTIDYYREKENKNNPGQNSWFTLGENVNLSEKMVLDTLLPGRFEESGIIRGEYVDIDVLKVPFYDNSGSLIGTVGIGRDVTADREIKKRLEREQKRYASIFNNIQVGLIICNPDGIITNVNKRAAKLLGYPVESLKGSDIDQYCLFDPSLQSLLKDTGHNSSQRGIREYLNRSSGLKKRIYYDIQPYLEGDGEVTEFLITVDEHYRDP